MYQASVRGFDIREAVFAWLDACNRKPKAELLLWEMYSVEVTGILDTQSFDRRQIESTIKTSSAAK